MILSDMTNRRTYSGIFISISLLVLVGTVAAVGNPDTVIVTSDKTWIVANNVDQSSITVTVTNTTSDPGPVQGVPVTLVVDPLYGTLSPATVITNAAGMASSTFKVKTKSGAAQINATIIASALSGSINQNIDHDTPYYDPSFSPPLFTYAPQGTVATEIPFKISVYDRWGNPIDYRRGIIPSVFK